jgi:hypothetical protein
MINQNSLMMTRVKNFVEENRLSVLAIPVVGILAGVGYYCYSIYNRSFQERAQMVFSQSLQELRHAEKDAEQWPNVELAAKTGYRSYKSSAFGPYFLVLESQAAVAQGNMQAAISLLEEALKQMGSGSLLYWLYKTKLARMKLDSDDASFQTDGYKELEKLASDKKNTMRDEALYCLGEYYMGQGERDRALKLWQELIREFSSQKDFSASPWSLLADEKLRS